MAHSQVIAMTGCDLPRIVGNPDDPGARRWAMVRDAEGHRTYKIKHRVAVPINEGPYSALYNTPGLPLPGSVWSIDNDFDEWAYCTQEASVEPVAEEGDPNEFFDIEQIFTTKPAVLCPDDSGNFEDPLLKADIISGGFIRYTEEASKDRNDQPLLTTSWEQLRGPQVEFDRNRAQVKIRQNVADLELDILADYIDSVNTFPQWGFNERCVKFSGCTWQKHYHVDCSVYYTRELEFEINVNTFDKTVIDEGTKSLPGHWDNATGRFIRDLAASVAYNGNTTNGDPNVTITDGGTKIVVGHVVEGTGIPIGTTVLSIALPTVTLSANATATAAGVKLKFGVTANKDNPKHFVRFKDRNNENTRVLLSASGYPWDPDTVNEYTDDDELSTIIVERYVERDHANLRIPSTI